MKRINVPPEVCARLCTMSIFTTVVLIVVTLVAAYLLWSLLLRAEHLYSVRFAARELWGSEAPAGDSVHLDLWDDHLEPA